MAVVPDQRFLDTQILIGAINGRAAHNIRGATIASVAALEFFGMQSSKPTQAAYYVPLLRRGEADAFETLQVRRDHPFSKYRTDSILMDFGTDFPSLIEYGNLAVSEIINYGRAKLFEAAIAHFAKGKRKALRSKLDLLLDAGVGCVPLTRPTVALAHRLLETFIASHKVKHAFRNTWNDMLIAATAAAAGSVLVTEDSLLQRHLAAQLGGSIDEHGGVLLLDFTHATASGPRALRESKGYVNRNWTIHFRANRAPVGQRSI